MFQLYSPHAQPHSPYSHPYFPHFQPDPRILTQIPCIPTQYPTFLAFLAFPPSFPAFPPIFSAFPPPFPPPPHSPHSVPHFPIPAFTDSQANLRVNTEKSKLYFNLIQKLICEFVVNLIKKWNCIANGKVFTLKNILHYNWVELSIFIQYLVISKLLSYQFFRVILTRNL